MKAEELRIGNWVKGDTGKPFQIELSDFLDWWNDHNSHEYGDHIHPIPLTEDWLVKFGFNGEINEISHCGNFYLNYDAEYGRHGMALWYQRGAWCFNHTNTFTVLKYVHQLQNLYFALTGEELTIKL